MFDYFEDAIDKENRDLEHRVAFPSKSTFLGKRWDDYDKNDRERDIRSCEGTLVITHTDADGYVSGALFKDFFEDATIVTADYDDLEETFTTVLQNLDTIDTIYVSDLNLDEPLDVIGAIVPDVDTFVWLDHHEWEEIADEVREMGVDVILNQERCGAGIVCDYLTARGYEPSESAKDIVEITEDHDLWKHELETISLGDYDVCISKVLSNFAFLSDQDDFINNILDYGYNFPEYEEEMFWADDPVGKLEESEREHREKIQYIIENETDIMEINGYTVGFAYGRASPGGILEHLNETEEIDILVHSKPSYPVKVSVRSTDSFNGCHKIAEEFTGGGHEQAAGFNVNSIQTGFEFTEYIHTHGRVIRDQLEEAVEKNT